MSAIEDYLLQNEPQAIEAISAFCRIPSVSTDPAYKDHIREAAGFTAAQLTDAGFPCVEIVETAGHPSIFAQWCETPNAPTILIYGHYDVQPPDPLEKWQSPPFEPQIRDGKIYARGVSDDKGPLMIPIWVVKAFKAVDGKLPLNVKVLIEGEEETGSPHFEACVAKLKDKLSCDLVVSADGAMWRPDLPSMTVASRGLIAMDVVIKGGDKDLHSGRHGGSAPNAVRALVQLLSTLHNDQGDVTVKGFSDKALPMDPAIAKAIRSVNFDTGKYFDDIGARRPSPLPSGEELLTRQWLRPTLEFNGISGGYAGPGTKTIIPALACAKITCRLVPGQDPAKTQNAIKQHLETHLPSGYRLNVENHGPGTPAFSLDPNSVGLNIASDILGDLLGAAPLRVAMGATIPVGMVLKKHLDVGTIFFSFSTSDEDYHAPNEHFRLSSLRTGLIAWARLFEQIGARQKI